MPEAPVILTLISDLFLAAPIEQGVRSAGYRLIRIDSRAELEKSDEPVLEQGNGRDDQTDLGAQLIRRLVEWQPALILVELSSQSIPWAAWIAAIKSSPATRRIPVLGFGPHTDLALRTLALGAGVDVVVAKSRLLAALPELIEQHARKIDNASLESDCAGQLSDLGRKGIALFNQGAYFEAHEELELAWGAENGPIREVYRGILQVAVAYLHVTRRNYRGALKVFLRLRQWLNPLPDECLGVDVAQLRQDAQAVQTALEVLGPERLDGFDNKLLKPVQLKQ
jgi:uncharacterized protein